jgi:putative salt-induced outer membrane protein YdiY/small nuclear ribonucleoprotein (snRNP)-like protein
VLRRFELLTLIAFLGLSSAVFADQVTLKNGDRLTGTVVKSDGKTLVLHTDAGGDLTIQFAAIQEMKTEKELHVTLKGGKTVVGPVTTTDGKLEIATKTGGTVEAPKDEVTLIRNDAEQETYDKSLHPGLRHGWTVGANVGFSVARGNSETENLALAFNAVHASLNDKITLYASSIDTTNNLATPSTVANLETGGFRYDRNIGPRMFAFVAADFQSNALQYLDLRSVYTGGFGAHVIKSDNTMLNFLAGVNYTHETYSNGAVNTPVTVPPTYVSYGVTNRFVALTLGEELTQQLGKSTEVTENFYFYPNLQQTGDYRTTFNIGSVTKLNKWLGWQNQFGDIYVSNPPIGAKDNDLIFTTGLNIAFVH